MPLSPLLLLLAHAAMAESPSPVPPPPWALSWADGNGNLARAWQDEAAGPVKLSWLPVRPETSSSGLYSGGEPRLETLEAAQVGELWTLARAVQGAPRVEQRAMGTGRLTVTLPAGEEQVLVAAGAASAALDTWLAGWRAEGGR